MPTVESHPFPPLLPPHASVMMMGSFPPALEKRCMDFHYPNFQNDMWRVFGLVFFDDAHHFYTATQKAFDAEKIKAFLWEKGIASQPTVLKAIREQGNASDKFLQAVEVVNLKQVLQQLPDCFWIATTGGKATEILLSVLPEALKMPKTNEVVEFHWENRLMKLCRLPSTSRAYPLSLQKKAQAYRTFFRMAGLV